MKVEYLFVIYHEKVIQLCKYIKQIDDHIKHIKMKRYTAYVILVSPDPSYMSVK